MALGESIGPILQNLEAKNPEYLLNLLVTILNQPPRYPITDVKTWRPEDMQAAIDLPAEIVLPGSFLDVQYLETLCAGLANDGLLVNGLNYPGRGANESIENIDELALIDYVHSAYYKLLELSRQRKSVYLVGHSLGTIVTMMLLLISYVAKEVKPEMAITNLEGVVIMGGGPPMISWRDYLDILLHRRGSIFTILQMMNNADKFISPEGAINKTVGSEEHARYMREQGWIYPESKAVMADTFGGTDYAYSPKQILDQLGVRSLFIYDANDLFVPEGSSMRAAEQWDADVKQYSMGHTGLVTEPGSEIVSHDIADWIKLGMEG